MMPSYPEATSHFYKAEPLHGYKAKDTSQHNLLDDIAALYRPQWMQNHYKRQGQCNTKKQILPIIQDAGNHV